MGAAAALFGGGVEGAEEGGDPALVGAVRDRRDDQQIAGAGGGDVGDPLLLGAVAGQGGLALLHQRPGHPADQREGPEAAPLLDPLRGKVAREAGARIAEDHHRELQALGAVHAHRADPFFSLSLEALAASLLSPPLRELLGRRRGSSDLPARGSAAPRAGGPPPSGAPSPPRPSSPGRRAHGRPRAGREGGGHGAAVALGVEGAQQIEGGEERGVLRLGGLGPIEGVGEAVGVAVAQQLAVAEGEEGPAEAGVDREAIVGVLDGAQGRRQREDLFAIEEGAAEGAQVRHAAGLQRLGVGAHHVPPARAQATEEEADVPRADGAAAPPPRCPRRGGRSGRSARRRRRRPRRAWSRPPPPRRSTRSARRGGAPAGRSRRARRPAGGRGGGGT